MRFQCIRRCPNEIRRPVLPGGHSVHYLRSRGRVFVPVGSGLRETGRDRLLVDGGFPRCPHCRLRLRMEERRARMGLSPTALKPGMRPAVAPAATGILDPSTGKTVGANDPYFLEVNHELSDKGLFVAAADALIRWRLAAMWDHSDTPEAAEGKSIFHVRGCVTPTASGHSTAMFPAGRRRLKP